MASYYSGSGDGSGHLKRVNFTGNPAAFSVSLWIYLHATQTSRVFFSNYSGTGPGWAIGIRDDASNKVKFYLGGATVNSPTLLSNTTWYHVLCTHDGTTGKIYLNGNTTPDASLTASLTYAAVTGGNWIGAGDDGGFQRANGRFSGVGYWSRALSSSDAPTLYNGGAGLAHADLPGGLLTGLGAYYDFANPAVLGHDSSSAARHMTPAGTGVVQAEGPGGPAPPVPTFKSWWSVRNEIITGAY